MLRARLIPVFGACLVGALGLVCPAAAQDATADGRLGDLILPGGLREALGAIHDRTTPDRSQFLVEVIRRVHHSPVSSNGVRTDILPMVLAHLDRAQGVSTAAAAAGRVDTLPLPLPASLWIETVFNGKATPQTLASAILRSRSASMLYLGLLSLDDPTRAWLAGQPDLVGALATRHTPAFAMMAPALRVANGRIQVPGGEAAVAGWEEIVGQPVTQPANFIRALLDRDEHHLPYFYAMLAPLTPLQTQMMLRLDAPDAPTRAAALKALLAVVDRIGAKWQVESRAFWRPSFDPALLVADLRVGEDGRPVLPGTRRFWSAVFAEANPHEVAKALVEDQPVDFVWLCEQVFDGPANTHLRRYMQVLFASRVVSRLSAEQAIDAVEAVRAAGRFPALVMTLERVHVTDVSVMAAAARRAARLTEIADDDRTVRALAQFQGALTLLTRAAWRGSLSTDVVAVHIRALSAIDLAKDDTYDGRVARWLDTLVTTRFAAPKAATPPATATVARNGRSTEEDVDDAAVERELLGLIAGPTGEAAEATMPHTNGGGDGGGRGPAGGPRFVVWEGMRYRVDLSAAEARRLDRVRGEKPRPYLSASRALARMGDALEGPAASTSGAGAGTPRDRLQRAADLLARVANAVGWPDAANWREPGAINAGTVDRYRALAASLPKPSTTASTTTPPQNITATNGAGPGASGGAGGRLGPPFRALADDLLARGLAEMVYAIALGQPTEVGISADEAASHHDFGLRAGGVRQRFGPWQLPATHADSRRDSQARGSLLGLDVSLAPLALQRLSSKLPPRRPSLNEDDRRAMTHAVALVEEARLADTDRDAIVAALRRGRERLAEVKTSHDAMALADEIRLSGMRRSLIAWVADRDRARLASFLSPSELLWLGLERTPVDARLHAWGAPGEPRIGCLCLQMIDRRPWEMFASRWGTGIFASAFPDLNLRLAELLADLRMPSALLGPVLTSATLDFVNTVDSRDADDRRGVVAFADALTPDRLELYLALLTTDGALVPLAKSAEVTTTMGAPR